MFDKYDEIFAIFNDFILKKLTSENHEIRGIVKNLKNVIKEKYKIELPIIKDTDRELIYSVLINYVDARKQRSDLYRSYNAKRITTINKQHEILKEFEKEMFLKDLNLLDAEGKVKLACQKYANVICIATYYGNITLELLEQIKNLGYDGSYGNNNLRLAFSLYNSNYDNKLKLEEMKKTNEDLISEINCIKAEKKNINSQVVSLSRQNALLQDELNRANILIDTYQDRLNFQKVHTKNYK